MLARQSTPSFSTLAMAAEALALILGATVAPRLCFG